MLSPREPTLFAIARAAQIRSNTLGPLYRLDAAPLSPYSRLSGNLHPNETPIRWLRGRYKCNQFVGDVLTDAGFQMPTYRMPDGSHHYVNAEALPRYRSHFSSVTSLQSLRPGDLLVLDRTQQQGENGAHVEVIDAVSAPSGYLHSIGAHRDGAYGSNRSVLLRSLIPIGNSAFASAADSTVRIYFLRPTRALS